MTNEQIVAILDDIRRKARELPTGTGNDIINKCNRAQLALGNAKQREVLNEGPGGQPHFESQAKAVLAYMEEGHTITSLEALRLFGIISFPRRILDIEKMTGKAPRRRRIETVNRYGKSVHVNEYWIDKDE